jgi:SAM-dependent methyltransferase
MPEIEERFEVPSYREPDYGTRVLTEEQIAAGAHRKWVGGSFEEHGRRQLDFLLGQGLSPHDRLLDVGCGSLRAGRLLVDYLDAGNYYGIDANRSVIQAGYDQELTPELRAKLPSTNLRASDRFGVDFGVDFDVALAQSVFTHVSLNHVRLCFSRVAQVMRPGGRFFVTFNEQPADFPVDGVVQTKRNKYTERNVYWYYRRDIRWAASFSPWDYRYIGRWGHPGGQRMVQFTRRPEPVQGGTGSVGVASGAVAPARLVDRVRPWRRDRGRDA